MRAQAVALAARLLGDRLDAVTGGRLELRRAGPPAPVVARAVGHADADAADLWLVLPRRDEALAAGLQFQENS